MYQIRKQEPEKTLADLFQKRGGGIASKLYQKLANVYRRNFCNGKSRALYDGEMHPLCANFCGPGTKIEKADVRNYAPYNAVDAVCKKHDIAYMDAKGNAEKVRQADIDMLKELEQYKSSEPYYTLAKIAISGKMKFEDLLPGLAKRISPEHYGKKAAGLADYFKPLFNRGLQTILKSKMGGQVFPKNAKKEGERKSLSSTSREIKNGIKIIMESDSDMMPYGSWTYKSQLYPGDVDLIEVIEKCCSKEEATNKMVQSMKNIVNKIQTTKGFYVGDIKSGVDTLFKLDIGNITYDNKGYHITGFNPELVSREIKTFARKGLLGREETEQMLDLIIDIEGNHNVQENYEELADMLREKWVLRWTAREVLSGYKVLPGQRKITLHETINQQHMTKIDMWTLISGRYIEFSNMLSFVLVDKFGTRTVLNQNPSPEEIINGIKIDITKLLYSKIGFKPFKAMKRMWSIGRIENHPQVIDDLTPIMQSDLGRLSQITSEIETIINMIEKVDDIPMDNILNEIDGWRYRLENVYDIDIDQNMINEMIKSILSDVSHNVVKNVVIEKLTMLKKKLKVHTDENALQILKKIGYYPLKKEFLLNV